MADPTPSPSAPPKYRKLPGSGVRGFGGFGTRCTLWMGPDHLLQVEATRYAEEYKRFYFKDIKAITLRRTRRWEWVGAALLAVLLLFGLIYVMAAEPHSAISPGQVASLMAGVPLLLMFLAHVFWGPTCACTLRTFVQEERLYSLGRLRRVGRNVALIRIAVEAAQGRLSEEQQAEITRMVNDHEAFENNLREAFESRQQVLASQRQQAPVLQPVPSPTRPFTDGDASSARNASSAGSPPPALPPPLPATLSAQSAAPAISRTLRLWLFFSALATGGLKLAAWLYPDRMWLILLSQLTWLALSGFLLAAWIKRPKTLRTNAFGKPVPVSRTPGSLWARTACWGFWCIVGSLYAFVASVKFSMEHPGRQPTPMDMIQNLPESYTWVRFATAITLFIWAALELAGLLRERKPPGNAVTPPPLP